MSRRNHMDRVAFFSYIHSHYSRYCCSTSPRTSTSCSIVPINNTTQVHVLIGAMTLKPLNSSTTLHRRWPLCPCDFLRASLYVWVCVLPLCLSWALSWNRWAWMCGCVYVHIWTRMDGTYMTLYIFFFTASLPNWSWWSCHKAPHLPPYSYYNSWNHN